MNYFTACRRAGGEKCTLDEGGSRLDEEAQHVTVRFGLLDEPAAHLAGGADEVAKLADRLRVQRDALAADLLEVLVAEDHARAVDGGGEDADFAILPYETVAGASTRGRLAPVMARLPEGANACAMHSSTQKTAWRSILPRNDEIELSRRTRAED
eukprot:CAMPEP_0184090162 /NCGR_PEP_ID=MMETSP0974-20121125/7092_1 /TAXON_ID=483370 /ORGANISM="non described non described, Strain CCMP2097" /LENGTH=154 /DNA_ID=CAMNT_0026392885 /DNA_START=20 /DNA_END=482 /DNA_ORIENTATION=-